MDATERIKIIKNKAKDAIIMMLFNLLCENLSILIKNVKNVGHVSDQNCQSVFQEGYYSPFRSGAIF